MRKIFVSKLIRMTKTEGEAGVECEFQVFNFQNSVEGGNFFFKQRVLERRNNIKISILGWVDWGNRLRG